VSSYVASIADGTKSSNPSISTTIAAKAGSVCASGTVPARTALTQIPHASPEANAAEAVRRAARGDAHEARRGAGGVLRREEGRLEGEGARGCAAIGMPAWNHGRMGRGRDAESGDEGMKLGEGRHAGGNEGGHGGLWRGWLLVFGGHAWSRTDSTAFYSFEALDDVPSASYRRMLDVQCEGTASIYRDTLDTMCHGKKAVARS